MVRKALFFFAVVCAVLGCEPDDSDSQILLHKVYREATGSIAEPEWVHYFVHDEAGNLLADKRIEKDKWNELRTKKNIVGDSISITIALKFPNGNYQINVFQRNPIGGKTETRRAPVSQVPSDEGYFRYYINGMPRQATQIVAANARFGYQSDPRYFNDGGQLIYEGGFYLYPDINKHILCIMDTIVGPKYMLIQNPSLTNVYQQFQYASFKDFENKLTLTFPRAEIASAFLIATAPEEPDGSYVPYVYSLNNTTKIFGGFPAILSNIKEASFSIKIPPYEYGYRIRGAWPKNVVLYKPVTIEFVGSVTDFGISADIDFVSCSVSFSYGSPDSSLNYPVEFRVYGNSTFSIPSMENDIALLGLPVKLSELKLMSAGIFLPGTNANLNPEEEQYFITRSY